MTRILLLAALLTPFVHAASDKPLKASGANYNIPLWDDAKVPLAKGDGPLDRPFLTVFAPPAGKRNGGSVVIAPGGSNIMLMYGVEGMEVAERLQRLGRDRVRADLPAVSALWRRRARGGRQARDADWCGRARRNSSSIPKRVGYHRIFGGLEYGRARGGCFGSRRSERLRPDRTREFAARITWAGLRAGPRDAGRVVERISRRRSCCAAAFDTGAALGFRAVLHGSDQGRRGRRNPCLSEGPARLRQRLRQPGIRGLDDALCSTSCNWTVIPGGNEEAF